MTLADALATIWPRLTAKQGARLLAALDEHDPETIIDLRFEHRSGMGRVEPTETEGAAWRQLVASARAAEVGRDWRKEASDALYRDTRRAKLASLRAALTSAKAARAPRRAKARAQCERAKARAKVICTTARARAKATSDRETAAAREALATERASRRVERVWTAKPRSRATAARATAERRAHSDDEIRDALPAELRPAWEAMRHRITAIGRMSRLEAFEQWAHDHGAEVQRYAAAAAQLPAEDELQRAEREYWDAMQVAGDRAAALLDLAAGRR